jgi:hypothetical protein
MPVPWNPSAATPTMVSGRPFTMTARPTTAGSWLNRLVQKRWLNTTTFASAASVSSSRNRLPAAGTAPSTVK